MTHTLLHFILNLLIFGCNLALIVCILMVISFDYSHFDILTNQIRNWHMSPISEIAIAKKSPMNFSPLFNYTNPGTQKGCDCIGIYTQEEPEYTWEGNLSKGECVSTQLIAGCRNVNEINSFTATEIEGEFGIYYKRNEKVSYYDWYNENIYDNCSEVNMQSCGVIDTIGNNLCVRDMRQCPSIYIDKSALAYYEYINKESYNEINNIVDIISSNYLMYIEFESYTSEKICIKQSESFIYGNNMSYILFENDYVNDEGKEKGCQSSLLYNITTDLRYSTLFTTTMNTVVPKGTTEQIKALPLFAYSTFINSKINLFSRGYIGWSKRCKDYLPIIEKLVYLRGHLRAYFTLFLVNSLIVLPYYLLFIMIVTQIDYTNYKMHFLLSLSYTLFIVLFILMVGIEYKGVLSTKGYINEIALKQCGDNITNRLFFTLLYDFDIIQYEMYYSLLWNFFMFFASILKLFLVITKTNKRLMMLALLSSNNPSINANLITPVETEMIII